MALLPCQHRGGGGPFVERLGKLRLAAPASTGQHQPPGTLMLEPVEAKRFDGVTRFQNSRMGVAQLEPLRLPRVRQGREAFQRLRQRHARQLLARRGDAGFR